MPRVGQRIVLRRLQPDDLAAFQAYRHDEEVGRYQGWSPVPDPAAQLFLKQMREAELFQPGEWFQIGIAERETDLLVGDIGICARGGEAEIGFTLRGESQGLGLGREAASAAMDLIFDQSGAAKIVAVTDSRNLPAIRLLERLSMRRTRTVEAVFRNQPCTEFVYSITRPPGR